MESYLKFEKFITPTFIQVIFWTGVAGITIFALLSVVSTMSYQPAMAILILLIGLPLYLVFWRVYCEVMLVLFRILGELQAIKKQGES
jgi:hypothetical protein